MYLLQQNVSYNKDFIKQSNADGTINITELDWNDIEKVQDSLKPPFDFVIGSDIVYQMEAVKPLVKTLDVLCDAKTVCLLSLEVRDEYVHEEFFKQTAQIFSISKIPKSKQHSDFKSEYCTIYNLRKKAS